MHQLAMAGTSRIVFLACFAIVVAQVACATVDAGQQWKPVAENRAFSEWNEASQSWNRRADVAPLAATPVETPEAERTAKFINFRKVLSSTSNEIDVEEDIKKSAQDNTATAALSGIYTDCISQFSLTCVQKKVMVFLDRLGRMESFGIMGDFMSVVRTNKEVETPIEEADLKDEADMDAAAARFFDNHVVRVTLPSWSGEEVAEGKSGTSIDLSVPTTAVEEGRKKKKVGGKMMKKLMMMLGMAAAAKMALMIPLGILIIKIKAVKALIIGKIALMISKFLLIKKLLAKKGGGGGGKEKHIILVHAEHGHGGGGGGHGGGHSSGGDSYGPPSGGGYSGGGGSSYSSGGHGGDSGWSSGGSGGHSSGGGGGGWSGGGGGSSGWGRSLQADDAQTIAYRGQKPSN